VLDLLALILFVSLLLLITFFILVRYYREYQKWRSHRDKIAAQNEIILAQARQIVLWMSLEQEANRQSLERIMKVLEGKTLQEK
jgi:hypothetical protein